LELFYVVATKFLFYCSRFSYTSVIICLGSQSVLLRFAVVCYLESKVVYTCLECVTMLIHICSTVISTRFITFIFFILLSNYIVIQDYYCPECFFFPLNKFEKFSVLFAINC